MRGWVTLGLGGLGHVRSVLSIVGKANTLRIIVMPTVLCGEELCT